MVYINYVLCCADNDNVDNDNKVYADNINDNYYKNNNKDSYDNNITNDKDNNGNDHDNGNDSDDDDNRSDKNIVCYCVDEIHLPSVRLLKWRCTAQKSDNAKLIKFATITTSLSPYVNIYFISSLLKVHFLKKQENFLCFIFTNLIRITGYF